MLKFLLVAGFVAALAMAVSGLVCSLRALAAARRAWPQSSPGRWVSVRRLARWGMGLSVASLIGLLLVRQAAAALS